MSESTMPNRPTIIILAFVAGAALFSLAPGLSTTVQLMAFYAFFASTEREKASGRTCIPSRAAK
jgi:hypothetical protein